MRSFLLSLTVVVALAGAAVFHSKDASAGNTKSTSGISSKKPATKTQASRPVVQRASVSRSTQRTTVRRAAAKAQTTKATTPAAAKSSSKPTSRTTTRKRTTPQDLRASRYGGFAPAPVEAPPVLDTSSPRSLSLVNVNTQESLSVTYWSNGAYHRDALNKLNHFLRDSQNAGETEMDPLLFDVLWHTMQIVGFGGTVEVLSAYRSPSTNAWLASVSRGVARDSQHMNGNAMDIRFPGVPVFKIRQAARALNMGGVGFYPRSGFVHLDTGPVRYW